MNYFYPLSRNERRIDLVFLPGDKELYEGVLSRRGRPQRDSSFYGALHYFEQSATELDALELEEILKVLAKLRRDHEQGIGTQDTGEVQEDEIQDE